MLNLPQRKGGRAKNELPVLNTQQTNTVISHLQSRAGSGSQQYLLNQRAPFKIELPHLAGGGADQTTIAER
jgi:hypothetical protein